MDSRCIFCGEELGILQKKKLYCGCASQLCCGACYEKYGKYPSLERARLALRTGRAARAEELREYVEQMETVRQEEEEKARREKERRVSEKKCLRCGGRLLEYGPITLKLGEETFFFSDLNRLMSGSLVVSVLRCEACGKAEFYIPDEKGLSSVSGSEEK